MRRRSLQAEIIAGAATALVVGTAAVVVYLTLHEVAAAARSGLLDRAFQMGAAALLAVVVGVVAPAVYSRWRNVTERPDRRERRRHVPTLAEIVAVGVVVAGLVLAAWPVVVHAYRGAIAAVSSLELAWAVGYGVAGIAFLWLVVWSLTRYVPWQRQWLRRHQDRLDRPGRAA